MGYDFINICHRIFCVRKDFRIILLKCSHFTEKDTEAQKSCDFNSMTD